MQGVYLPVVRALGDRLEAVGFTSRDSGKGASAAAELGLPWFPHMAALAREAKPDLIALCVPPAANVPLAREAMRLRLPVLMETPVSPRLGEARALVRDALREQALIGVAEQKPYLPMEQFKAKLIASGALGRVRLAQNDYRSYDYHAIAQLRAYLPRRGGGCRRVRCLSVQTPLPSFRGQDGRATRPRMEKWDLATLEMGDGSILIHNFSDASKSAPFRIRPLQRVLGEAGSLADTEIAGVGPDGAAFRTEVGVEWDGARRAPLRLTAHWPGGSAVWENPFPETGLGEDQIALACHFMAMRDASRGKGGPLYSLSEALIDLEILTAMRFSARMGGAAIPLPFGPAKAARMVAASPVLWGRAISFALAKAFRRGSA